jgi:type II secretory pathway pseudopilin PulG
LTRINDRGARGQSRRTGPKTWAAFTFVELIVVMAVVLILLAMGLVHFRNTRAMATSLTDLMGFHMQAKTAGERLKSALVTGTELVKPVAGRSLPYLVLKDLTNRTVVLYLEQPSASKDGPWQMVMYTHDYSPGHKPAHRQVLFTQVASGSFTSLGPGLVLANLTLVDSRGRQLGMLVEAPLKNFGTVPEH